MSERQEKKRRYNLRLEYIASFNRWIASEPPKILFWRWRKWRDARPVFTIEKGRVKIGSFTYIQMAAALCTPCVMELRRKGRRLKEIPARREKVTCWLCDRRRYGLQYIMGDGKNGR